MTKFHFELPPMSPVQSSNVAAIGYEDGALYVRYKGGAVYRYANVPLHLYEALLRAPSVGQFLRSMVILHPDRYPFTQARSTA